MAGAKRGARRTTPKRRDSRPTSEIVATVCEAVRARGDFPRAAIAKMAIPKAQLLDVFDALANAGLELGKRSIREPLEGQIESKLVDGRPLPLRKLETALRGATAPEAKQTAAALVERGRAALTVLADGELALVGRNAPLLDARMLERLDETVVVVTKRLRVAKKKRASLLRADVERLLEPFVVRRTVERDAVRAVGDVASLVDEHRERSGLTSVPKLVRALGGLRARDALHAELLRGARAGRFELRPESGMGRLSEEDASFCIPGPQGSRLSWVRRIEETS